MKPLKEYLRLYLVLETSMLKLPLEDFIGQAVDGGVTAIQLRDKGATANERLATANKLKRIIADKDVLFIVNDDPDLARAVGAHGVHLGPTDMPPDKVRLMFPELIIGCSCNDFADTVIIKSAGVHYAGIGPVFLTITKTDARPVIGVDGMHKLAEILPVPSVAIGGITENNVGRMMFSANAGVAVASALCKAENPQGIAAKIRASVDKYRPLPELSELQA
ncbi:thiamine phosphate synthase [Deferribacterales bacterium RsTz2092]|nr:thiamine-phosphate synthase [Deferribacterales bacterium]